MPEDGQNVTETCSIYSWV